MINIIWVSLTQLQDINLSETLHTVHDCPFLLVRFREVLRPPSLLSEECLRNHTWFP
jgi:hypothetical protein